jgi:hypothetical protein
MGRVMTIILALLGIGIFAIPAALLSSAFSDQLRIERESLKNELHDMLSDGVLSLEESDKLYAEAKRLHLSHEDVTRLIEQVRREFEEKEDVAILPLHKIAAMPEHAVEHFKSLVSQIRQLGLLTNGEQFEAAAARNSSLTPGELNLWRHLQVKVAPPP